MALAESDLIEAAPHVGQTFGGRFRIKRLIGAGNFSLVLEADDLTTGVEVAIKALRITQLSATGEMRREGSLLQDLDNASHVVQLIDVGVQPTVMSFAGGGGTQTFNIPWLALELADGRVVDLIAHLPSFRWSDRLEVFRDCARGLHQMHLARIVHRDLKTDNVLMFAGPHRSVTTKVADLGRAANTSLPRGYAPDVYAIPRGDARFAPPELLWGLGEADPETMCRADLYLLGSLFYELATGHGMTPLLLDPLATRDQALTMSRDERGRGFRAQLPTLLVQIELAYATFGSALPTAIRYEGVELLRQLTNPDPEKRYASGRKLAGLPTLWDLQWVLRRIDILRKRLAAATIASRPRRSRS